MVMRHIVLTVAEVAKERQLRPERSRREGAQRLIGWEEGSSLEGGKSSSAARVDVVVIVT